MSFIAFDLMFSAAINDSPYIPLVDAALLAFGRTKFEFNEAYDSPPRHHATRNQIQYPISMILHSSYPDSRNKITHPPATLRALLTSDTALINLLGFSSFGTGFFHVIISVPVTTPLRPLFTKSTTGCTRWLS